MTMTFTMMVSHNEAAEVRVALVQRITYAKRAMKMRMATEDERMALARTVLTLENILRRDYGDYDPSETAQKEVGLTEEELLIEQKALLEDEG